MTKTDYELTIGGKLRKVYKNSGGFFVKMNGGNLNVNEYFLKNGGGLKSKYKKKIAGTGNEDFDIIFNAWDTVTKNQGGLLLINDTYEYDAYRYSDNIYPNEKNYLKNIQLRRWQFAQQKAWNNNWLDDYRKNKFLSNSYFREWTEENSGGGGRKNKNKNSSKGKYKKKITGGYPLSLLKDNSNLKDAVTGFFNSNIPPNNINFSNVIELSNDNLISILKHIIAVFYISSNQNTVKTYNVSVDTTEIKVNLPLTINNESGTNDYSQDIKNDIKNFYKMYILYYFFNGYVVNKDEELNNTRIQNYNNFIKIAEEINVNSVLTQAQPSD